MNDASMNGNTYFRLQPADPMRGSFEDQDTYQGQPLQALLGRASLIATAHDPKSGFQLGGMPSNRTLTVLGSVRTDHDRGTAFSIVQSKEQSSNDQSSTASNYVPDDLSSGFCAICADKATGNHYGVISCNGCKGFFRRTCWKKQRYICRFTDNCIVDKDHRNACRFCRFQKCLNAGMKREAIQNERDSIGCSSKKKCGVKGKRKRSQPNPDDTDDDSDVEHEETRESPSSLSDSARKRSKNDQLLDALLEMEARCNLYRHSMVTTSSARQNVQSIAEAVESPSDFARPASNFYRGLKKANIDDLQDSWRTTLLLLVEWAKGLKPFPDLPTEDKLSLLRNYAAQHLLLLPAYKSPNDSIICLVNDCYVPRDTDLPDINNVVNRCLDELVAPMRRMEMTDAEFVLMKTVVFMNPETKGLQDDSRSLVRLTREQAIQSLYDYEHKHFTAVAPKRFGTLLLLAPQLKEIAQLLVENIQLVKLFGLATIDQLLEELLLDDSDRSGKKNVTGGSAGSFEVGSSFTESRTNDPN